MRIIVVLLKMLSVLVVTFWYGYWNYLDRTGGSGVFSQTSSCEEQGQRRTQKSRNQLLYEKDWKDTLTAKYFLQDSEKTLLKYVLVRLFSASMHAGGLVNPVEQPSREDFGCELRAGEVQKTLFWEWMFYILYHLFTTNTVDN